MYEAFYGLTERPFELTPNPRYLFLTPKHREALAHLRYGLSGQRGITLLLGDAGTGKTTLVRAALAAEQRAENRYVLLANPTLRRHEFYEFLAAGFRLGDQAAQSKTRFLFDLQRDLQDRHARGGATSLVVDEAQSLPFELLEELRLLVNLETATVKLLNVILVSQPELAERLNDPALRQLKQRISLRCELGHLDLRETAAYIAGRLRIAGANVSEVFTRDAVLAVDEYARGIPRVISVVCDNALVAGFALGARPVGAAIVHEVARDFDLRSAVLAAPATAGDLPAGPAASGPAASANVAAGAAPTEIQTGADVQPTTVAPPRRHFSFF